jgi:hypothetical protein
MYKIKKELPKEFKIKVNPEQSEALQKHLFSLGYNWGFTAKEPKYLDSKYLYLYVDGKLMHGNCKKSFQEEHLPRIKFKDYFAFPEKWCILITEDNYKELNVYLHKNCKNYKRYQYTWSITFDDGTYFYSDSGEFNLAVLDYKMEAYTLITTKQFRKHFGKPTQIEELKTINKLTNH